MDDARDPTGETMIVSDGRPLARALEGGISELVAVLAVAVALAAALTYPLAFRLGSVGRVRLDDWRFSVWNVAWVARTLVVDPLHVYDANIFYPRRGTLAYSENNLGAGLLAVPAYWATRNPYFAHNFVMLSAFVLTAAGTYYLVRYLTEDRRAAAVSAICFAYCPFVLSHTAHIQLQMTAWLPLSMLAFHRLADRPTPKRGVVLGLVMTAQAISCGYYGVFVALMIGFAAIVIAVTRKRWTDTRYWRSLAVGAAVPLAIVVPLFAPYAALQRGGEFSRSLADALRWSADWRAYLASASYAHAWMLGIIGHWNEVLFPGFVATVGGAAGLWVAARARNYELATVYGGLAALATWASFGPPAGLYTALYYTIPVFAFLRAPSRFGLIVAFGLSVLAGVAMAALLRRAGRPAIVSAVIVLATVGEHAVRIDFRTVPPVEPAYRLLAALPPGPLIEMPFFEQRLSYPRHTLYMLASTTHWMPLVNGYSDYIPPDFRQDAAALASLPLPSAFRVLQRDGVRYAMFHLNAYDAKTRAEVEARLAQYASYLRPLYADGDMRLYEIVGFPP